MLVYGDRSHRGDPRDQARWIKLRLDKADVLPPGIERHSTLVSAFIEAGRLWQGLADAEFAIGKVDRQTEEAGKVGDFVLHLGRSVCRSWDSGFEETGAIPRLEPSSRWPSQIEMRVPEGFAFYALYPEAFAEAARQLKLCGTPRVIGIRSIGTTLGAIVAAALHAGRPITVRPFGDPYDRRIALDLELEHALLRGDPHFVIVDEGPGNSGSSFASVAGWLHSRGVPTDRIAFVPSHAGGPGAAASEEIRQWWRAVQRQSGDFGDRLQVILERWCSKLIGPVDAPLRDLSGGRWRELHYARTRDWPASISGSERRKYLAYSDGQPLLLKFAGLGRIGEDKLRIAQQLAVDNVVPEPVGVVHGFLVERWRDDANPLLNDNPPTSQVALYLAARAKLFPADRGSGASIAELLEMARRNVSIELGEEAALALHQWDGRVAALDARVLPVRTDNKLQLHEWLRAKDGTLIKTDALDHHQAHDLIGCQDLAWDVSGAIAEFDLDQSRAEHLLALVEVSAGRAVDRELLDFYRVAYLAFRVGQLRLGTTMTHDVHEQQRLRTCGDEYAHKLQLLLELSERATRPESSVGGTTERTGSGTSLAAIG